MDREELSALDRIAPLGDKPPEALATVFGNGMFMCFVYADGLDCAALETPDLLVQNIRAFFASLPT